jgi:acyl dehydratase
MRSWREMLDWFQVERWAMNTYQKLFELQALVGSTLGTSDWIQIDQARIDQFAAVTGDVVPVMVRSAFKVGDVRMTVNYGLNRVRFPAPVPVGSRLRGHFKLMTFEPLDAGAQLVVEVTTEREGHAKPVCVAESVARHFT